MKTNLNYYKTKSYLFIFVLSTIFSACSDPTATGIVSNSNGEEISNGTSSNTDNAYPAENNNITAPAYPSLANESASPQSAYPAPLLAEEYKEPRFRFDLPLTGESISVSGQAVPNLAIAIVDITFNGVVLGSGMSDNDGRFNIDVQPLPQGHRIGITFADLQPGKSFDDMSREFYPHRGEGFMNLPNVGIFFDTALVE